MKSNQPKKINIIIPVDYSHLCIACGLLINKKAFMGQHREHNCIDRPSLESAIEENKEHLINYFLNDILRVRRANIVEQLDLAIQSNESRGSTVIKSIIGRTTIISPHTMNSVLCILQ